MWSSFEFDYRKKTPDWYWAVSIITICISAVSFIYGNSLFGIFIILAGATLLFNAKKIPDITDYELTEKGIVINRKTHPHIEFDTFWVAESKYASPKLLLKTSKISAPIIVIPIETDYVDAHIVRDFLLDYIPEDKINEPLSLRVMEILGF